MDHWFLRQLELGDLYRAEVRLRHLEGVAAFWGTPRPDRERAALRRAKSLNLSAP